MTGDIYVGLRKALDLFRTHERALVRSAFVRVTEQKIAGWSEGKQLRLIYRKEQLAAALVLKTSFHTRVIKDFSGFVRAEIQAGDLYVERFACVPGCEQIVADVLLSEKKEGRRAWLRIWQEHPVDLAVVHLASAKQIAVKVKPGGELIGVWCLNDVGVREVSAIDRITLCRLNVPRLAVAEARCAVFREAGQFINHYSVQYNKRQSWSTFALRGYGGKTDFIMKPSVMPKAWKRDNAEKLSWTLEDTSARKRCPELESLIDAVPGVKHRVRIMRLSPSGLIARHSDALDKEVGTSEGKIVRIHIPIVTNPGVWFQSWDLNGHKIRAQMREGEVWYLDIRKPHQVENTGATDRLHLVIDVVVTPQIQKLMRQNGNYLSARPDQLV